MGGKLSHDRQLPRFFLLRIFCDGEKGGKGHGVKDEFERWRGMCSVESAGGRLEIKKYLLSAPNLTTVFQRRLLKSSVVAKNVNLPGIKNGLRGDIGMSSVKSFWRVWKSFWMLLAACWLLCWQVYSFWCCSECELAYKSMTYLKVTQLFVY